MEISKSVKKISINIFILLISNAVAFVFSFLAARVANRALSPADYGIFNLVSFYMLILQNIADFGLNVSGVKYITQRLSSDSGVEDGKSPEQAQNLAEVVHPTPEFTENTPEILQIDTDGSRFPNSKPLAQVLWNVAYLKGLLYILGLPLVVGVVYIVHLVLPQTTHHDWRLIMYVMFSSISVLLLSAKSTIDIIQQVRHENYVRAFAEAMAMVFKFGVSLTVVYFLKGSIWDFILVVNLTALVSLAIEILVYGNKFPHIVKADFALMRKLAGYAAVTAMVMLVNYFFNEINKVVLDLVKSSYEVGIYSTPQKIFQTMAIVPNIIMIPLYTEISKSLTNLQQFRKIFRTSLIFMLIISLCASFITYVTAPWIIDFLGGSAYLPSVGVLQTISLSFPFLFLTHLFGYSLIAQGRERLYLAVSLWVLGLNLVMGFILGSMFGAMGSAACVVIVEFVICLITAGCVLIPQVKK